MILLQNVIVCYSERLGLLPDISNKVIAIVVCSLVIVTTKMNDIIESISGICNLYSKYSSKDMFTGAHVVEMGADHSRGPKTVKQTQNVNIDNGLV